jgi:hypothetical protein
MTTAPGKRDELVSILLEGGGQAVVRWITPGMDIEVSAARFEAKDRNSRTD